MPHSWPLVPLGDVLTQRKQFIRIDDMTTYKRCRVQLHGQGIVLRDDVPGIEIKTKEQQVCKAGDFLVAEIDAKVGGFGIVPAELAGAVVSSHYFLFTINAEKLDRTYLDYYIRTPTFQDQVVALGSTNYAAVRPKDVLSYTLPLPPLDEQRRIVARIAALATRISEARGLRAAAVEEAGKILIQALHQIFVDEENNWSRQSIGSISDIIDPNPSHRMPEYSESGIPFISTVDFEDNEFIKKRTAKYVTNKTYEEQLTRCMFSVGDILYSRIGTIGQARLLIEIWPFALSHVLVVVKANQDVVLPRFLLWYLRSDSIALQASFATQSIGVPDLGIKKIREFHIPLPPLAEQRRIVAYLDEVQARVDAIKALQGETAAELAALLPSVLDRAFRGEL